MENFWRSTAVKLGQHWKLAVGALLAVTIALGFGLTRLEFATGQDSYLNPDSQIALNNVEFQDTFGGEAVIMLFTANDGSANVTDLFAGDNLTELRRLNSELAEVDHVFSVVSPLTSLTYSSELLNNAGQQALLQAPARDEEGTTARTADIGLSLARLGEVPAEERVLDPSVGGTEPNPDWVELLLFDNTGFTDAGGEIVPPADPDRGIRLSLSGSFPDQRTAVGGVVLDGNLTLDEQSAATEDILEVFETSEFTGFDLTVTGSPVYLKEINDYLQGGMLVLGAIALLVMAVVLGLLFRVKWRLLPLLAVVIGVIWTFAIVGLVGIDLSLVTIAGLPILIGLGIDFAIQIHNRVDEESYLDRDEHPIAESVSNLAPPLIAATLAGVVAFLALRVSRVPMIRDFGLLLAIGVVVLVAIGIIVPATLLAIKVWGGDGTDRKESFVEQIVVRLGGLPEKAGLVLVLASVGLFVAGVAVEGRTKIQSDPVRWIDQGSQVVSDIEFLEDETGFSSTMGVIVKANNVFDQDVINLIHGFTIAAEERDDVVTSSSLVNTMGKIITIPGATVIPPSEDDIVAAAADARAAVPDISRALVNDDATAAQINLRLAPATLEERAELVDELKSDLDERIDALSANIDADSILLEGVDEGDKPVDATPAGLATVGIGLLENLSSNRAALTYLALAVAGLFLVLRFRSLSRGLLALVPVFLAVGASSLIIGLVGIELSPLTTVSGPLVVATCTEFSVLILGRYLEERQDGRSSRMASDRAAARTGRAFFTSAATTIGGFGVLIASPLPLLRDFGIIVTLNVTIALLAALVLMPPMMLWVDGRGLLGLSGERTPGSVKLAAPLEGGQAIAAGVGVAAFAAAAGGVYASADRSSGTAEFSEYAAVALPTTTTTTTTTVAPADDDDDDAGQAGPTVDPSGFSTEPPETPIASVLFDRITEQGVEPNVANCAIETAYQTADENTLISMGIAAGEIEPLDIVAQGAVDCGIEPATTLAAIQAQFPDITSLPALDAATGS